MTTADYSMPLNQRVASMRDRMHSLYRKGSLALQNDLLLSTAFEELSSALDVLNGAEQEHVREREQWLNERTALNTEIQRYCDLFVSAPIGYIVTSIDGTIRQANTAATTMLRSSERGLIGRSMSLFIPGGKRRAFRSAVAEIHEQGQIQEWDLELQASDGALFSAELIIASVKSTDGRPTSLRWLLRDVTHRRGVLPEQRQLMTEEEQVAMQAQQRQAQQAQQSQFSFLADASVVLAVAQDVAPSLAHVAQLAVPAIAQGCIIDLAYADRSGQQLLILDQQQEGTVTKWRNYIHAGIEAPSGETRVAKSESEISALVTTCFNEGNTRLPGVVRAAKPASLIAVPIGVPGHSSGTFALLSPLGTDGQPAISIPLVEELARRITKVLSRAI